MGYFDDLEIVQATHKIFGYHVSKPIEMKVLEKTIRSIKSGGGHRNATH